MQQDRRKERASRSVSLDDLEVVDVSGDDRCLGAELLQIGQHVASLSQSHQRSHPDGIEFGVADRHLRQPLAQRRYDRIDVGRRCERAADGRAFLPGFDSHLLCHFLDEQVELRASGHRVRGKNGGVERIPLGNEPDGFARYHRMPLQFLRRIGRSGEGNDILAGQVVEQIPGRTHHELQHAFGQDPGLADHPHQFMGDVARDGRRLGDDGNTCEQGRGQLLQHAPAGKVERVDVNRHAAQRHHDVLAGERAALGESFDLAVQQERRIGKFATAFAGIGEQRADTAVDVDHRVGPRGASLKRKLVKRFLMLIQMLGKLLQHGGALMESQPPEISAADGAPVVQDFAHVETTAGRERHDVAGDGAEHLRRILADRPASADETRKPHDVLRRLARQRAVRLERCHLNLLPWCYGAGWPNAVS